MLINLRMQNPDAINVRQTAEMLTGAWWAVSTTTIMNCWQKAGVNADNWTAVDANMEEDQHDAEKANTEPSVCQEVLERLGMNSPVPFKDHDQSDSQVEA